jgi:hypothetical protein
MTETIQTNAGTPVGITLTGTDPNPNDVLKFSVIGNPILDGSFLSLETLRRNIGRYYMKQLNQVIEVIKPGLILGGCNDLCRIIPQLLS